MEYVTPTPSPLTWINGKSFAPAAGPSIICFVGFHMHAIVCMCIQPCKVSHKFCCCCCCLTCVCVCDVCERVRFVCMENLFFLFFLLRCSEWSSFFTHHFCPLLVALIAAATGAGVVCLPFNWSSILLLFFSALPIFFLSSLYAFDQEKVREWVYASIFKTFFFFFFISSYFLLLLLFSFCSLRLTSQVCASVSTFSFHFYFGSDNSFDAYLIPLLVYNAIPIPILTHFYQIREAYMLLHHTLHTDSRESE